ncbi:hypothetical protein K438DRAFT_1770885 [Mycena galopus ATCC 62051]|nr:hypothetical protein K438DRAFT_1770885 [Mycena galopus ATCC 62051]
MSHYTPARHRAIIALRGGALAPWPAPITVSRDVQILYREGAKKVKEYFKCRKYSPRHSGVDTFHTLCMENASNCDGTSDALPLYTSPYWAALSRTRSFPHTINLAAKAFIAFFLKQPRKKAQEPEPELQEEEEYPVVAEVTVDEEGIMDEGKANKCRQFRAPSIEAAQRASSGRPNRAERDAAEKESHEIPAAGMAPDGGPEARGKQGRREEAPRGELKRDITLVVTKLCGPFADTKN